MIFEISFFIALWFGSFFLHEVMHNFAAWIKGSEDFCIIPDFANLSMTAHYYDYVKDPILISYAGGVFTSFFMFGLSFSSTGVLSFLCLTMGWIQLCYGIAEGYFSRKLSSKTFRRLRYGLYISILFIMSVWWLL